MTTNREIEQLRSEIEQLRSEVGRLRAGKQRRLDGVNVPDIDTPTSRRRMLGAAVAVTGAALLTSRPVAAADGDPLNQGELSECTETTEIRFPADLGPARPRSHVFVAQDGVWSTPASPTADNEPEEGTRSSIAAYSGNHVLHGVYGQTNTAILGSSGARFVGESAFAYGLMVEGRRATLRLRRPSKGDQSPPPNRFDVHNYGEITVDDNDDIWACVASGAPGTWRKLAGPASAGSFHAIEPARAFDSRVAAVPNSGKLAGNSSLVISIKDGRDVKTGAVTVADAVAQRATAVTYNVTITETVGAGFVYVAPGDAATITASSVNWGAPGTTIANAGTVKLDASRQVKVFCQANPAHVILDITGYYL